MLVRSSHSLKKYQSRDRLTLETSRSGWPNWEATFSLMSWLQVILHWTLLEHRLANRTPTGKTQHTLGWFLYRSVSSAFKSLSAVTWRLGSMHLKDRIPDRQPPSMCQQMLKPFFRSSLISASTSTLFAALTQRIDKASLQVSLMIMLKLAQSYGTQISILSAYLSSVLTTPGHPSTKLLYLV